LLFFSLSSSFSGLFGSNTKDVSPKRSTTMKPSSINDQIAPTKSPEDNLSSERSINENDDTRFEIYGWSVSNDKDQANVPVPVYCRPVFNSNDKTQVLKIEYLIKIIDFKSKLDLVCCWY
jgi:hypothetical protein